MNRGELAALIRNGEHSRVEFKRDDVTPEKLAREMAGLANLEGGIILLGVADDGSVPGLGRPRRQVEEWVMEIGRSLVQPPVNPTWETVVVDARTVGVVGLPADAPDKPYKARRGPGWVSQIRVGSTTRDCSRDEEARLYRQAGSVEYETTPVVRAQIEDLDWRRLRDYFVRVLGGEEPDRDSDAWTTLLTNLEFATEWNRRMVATAGGMLLFGKDPKRFLPQSGVRAICYPGTEPDYAARADEILRGPLVPLGAADGSLVEIGLVDQAWDFVRRNTVPSAWLDGPRRVDRWEYPEPVVREAVTNALVHRDYGIRGTDVLLAIYADRLEVRSPGRLPNTVSPDRMRVGARYSRNQTLVNIMRDYRYVEARGMGVRNRILPGMRAHNGTEPDLIEEEDRFTVRLWKDEPSAGTR